LAEAPSAGESVLTYAPKSRSAAEYKSLAEEINNEVVSAEETSNEKISAEVINNCEGSTEEVNNAKA